MTTSNTDTGDTTSTAVLTTSSSSSNNNDGGATTADLINPAPRESLITTAINFLQNAKVRHTTLIQKQQFLRSKGLTPDEIQIACERAGVFTDDPNNPNTIINMGISAQTHSQLALQPRQSAFGRIKEILNSVALLSSIAYAIYLFWKKFLAPFLFGSKKRKPIDDALEDIDKKVDTRINEVSQELTQIKETLTQQQRDHNHQLQHEFNNFKLDLEAIKGLLLNRKQFASPLTGSLAGAAAIPAWQLSSSPHHHHHRHSSTMDIEKADDAGSGSGSSETEVVTKNSDSSLEIM